MPRPVFELPATDTDDDPIEFQMGAVLYRCVDDLPATAVYALATSGAVVGAVRFIRGCVLPEFEDTFDAQLDEKARGKVVTDQVLAQVLKYLTRTYTGRPTTPPENWPGGRQVTNGSSQPEHASLV